LPRCFNAQGFHDAELQTDLRRQIMRLRAINQLSRRRSRSATTRFRGRYDELQRRSEASARSASAHIQVKLPDHPTEQEITVAKTKATDAIRADPRRRGLRRRVRAGLR